MAKTDWQMGDIVQPADLNQIGQEINDAADAAASAQGDIDAHKAATTPHAVLRGVNNFGFVSSGTPIEISNGAITVTSSYHVVDTEGQASFDELTTITGGQIGDILFLRQANPARDITIKHNAGNIFTWDGSDVQMDASTCVVILLNTGGTTWLVVGIQGVRRSGDTMTGELYLQSSLRIQGRNVYIDMPEVSGGWARGLYLRDVNGQSTLGGMGYYGSNEDLSYIFLGIGSQPWTLNTVGLRLRQDGRLSYVDNGFKRDLWHAGNFPTESGSWTPILYGQTTAGSPTYVLQDGGYYRIGKLVHIYFEVEISNKGGMQGRILLGGLPFPAKSGSGLRQSANVNELRVIFPENAKEVYGMVSSVDPIIFFTFRNYDGSANSVGVGDIIDGFVARGSATYLID